MTGDSSLNLIQKAAERLAGGGGLSLIERAAQRAKDDAARGGETAPSQPAPSTQGTGDPTTAAPQALRRRASHSIDINLSQLALNGLIVPTGEKTHLSEEYRILKRPLLLKAFSDEGRAQNAHLIMVTSARPGEGKTFTAVNLALSIASESDLNVMIVDADVHRPSVLPRLGVSADRGLVDLLTDDQLSLPDVLLRANNVPNLSILPAGRFNARSTELFASQRMGELIGDLAKRFSDRVIIIDTPPVLASSEPSVIALHVGQIVMVVEAERTSQRAVESALHLISRCPNINLLLNKAKSNIASEQFGSYAYAYGYYGSKKS